MMLSKTQIQNLSQLLEKYPDADFVVIKDVPNGSGIGPSTVANVFDQGNMFKRIKPKKLGVEDITDVGLW
jgi:hypothetical protein